MDELEMSVAKRRMIRGRFICQAQSRFLDEIGTDGVTYDDRTTSFAAPAARSFRPAGNSSGRSAGGFYKDVDTREQIEALEKSTAFPPEYEHLRAGSMVHHRKHGPGKVMKIVGRWPETRVDVMFAELGLKRLVLAMAPLDVEM